MCTQYKLFGNKETRAFKKLKFYKVLCVAVPEPKIIPSFVSVTLRYVAAFSEYAIGTLWRRCFVMVWIYTFAKTCPVFSITECSQKPR